MQLTHTLRMCKKGVRKTTITTAYRYTYYVKRNVYKCKKKKERKQ